MKSFLLVLAALAVSLPVSAGNTQVSAADYRVMGASGPYYGRSDGLFIDTTSKGPVIINNGTAADMFGKSYYEDFTKWGHHHCDLDLHPGRSCHGEHHGWNVEHDHDGRRPQTGPDRHYQQLGGLDAHHERS